ncbi:MAG TPA: metallopeptidase family protein, partial [Pedomonas sp.]|nr:metallopeptidase family protein [Pedomonas sp.]
MQRQTLPPALADVEAIAREALERLPDPFRGWLKDVVLRIEDFPDEDVMEAMGLETPFDILGLYQGYPIGEKSVSLSGALPDIIFLYRRPILDYWA